MPAVPDTGPDAGSNLVSGDGTNVATFTLPSSPRYVVQSVVATVDNSAGADTTATLTMADSNGAVIAKRAQGETLDAGASGTATFALRLAASNGSGIRFGRTNTGSFLDVITTTHGGSAGYAINLETTGASTANGIRLSSVADVSLYADTTAQMYGASLLQLGVTDAGQPMLLETNGGTFDVQTNAGALTISTDGAVSGDVRVLAGLGTVDVRGDTIELNCTGDINLRVKTGHKVTVFDNSGNPIFRVNEDGSLQGKTGKALTFNL